jgi:hypothetical protein
VTSIAAASKKTSSPPAKVNATLNRYAASTPVAIRTLMFSERCLSET